VSALLDRAAWLQGVCANANDARDHLTAPGSIIAPDGTAHDMATNGHMALVLPATDALLVKHPIGLPSQTAWMFAERETLATASLDALRAWAICPVVKCACCGVELRHPHAERFGDFGPARLNLRFVGAVIAGAPGESVRLSWDGPNNPVYFDGDGWRGLVIGVRDGEVNDERAVKAGAFPAVPA
jgi:hypothetical protein